jgi:uncharacterized protein YggT (Ycf19 family)
MDFIHEIDRFEENRSFFKNYWLWITKISREMTSLMLQPLRIVKRRMNMMDISHLAVKRTANLKNFMHLSAKFGVSRT